MLKSFGIGSGLLVAVSLISLFLQDISVLMKYSGIVGLGFMGIAAVLSGILGSGDRIRANSSGESADEIRNRFRLARNFFIVGLPNTIASAVIYIVFFV